MLVTLNRDWQWKTIDCNSLHLSFPLENAKLGGHLFQELNARGHGDSQKGRAIILHVHCKQLMQSCFGHA